MSFTLETALDTARDGHGAALYRNFLLYACGETTGVLVPATSPLMGAPIRDNIGTLGNMVPMGPPCYAAKSVMTLVYQNLMYLGGGLNGATYQTTLLLGHFNPLGTIDRWITLALPIPVAAGLLFVLDGFLYLAGGLTTGGVVQTGIYRAPLAGDGTLGAWQKTSGVLPTGSNATNYVLIGRKLYWANAVGNVLTIYWTSIQSNGSNGPITSIAGPAAIKGFALYQGYRRLILSGGVDTATGLVAQISSWESYLDVNTGTPIAWTLSSPVSVGLNAPVPAQDPTGRIYLTGGLSAVASPVSQTTVQYSKVDYEGNV